MNRPNFQGMMLVVESMETSPQLCTIPSSTLFSPSPNEKKKERRRRKKEEEERSKMERP
jgi:hypothetical protein